MVHRISELENATNSSSLANVDDSRMILSMYAGFISVNFARDYCLHSRLARMRVPKMVKNGFDSVLQTSAGSRRLVAARNS